MQNYIRISIIVLSVTLFGLYLGSKVDSFLSISIEDKPYHKLSTDDKHIDYTELSFRMVDLGGVGIEPDKSIWGKDYSHNTKRFQNLFLSDAPFVDEKELEKVYSQYTEYMDRMAELGLNVIEFQVFLELIDFDLVGDGSEVYAEDGLYKSRHEAIRAVYNKFFSYAKEKGFKIVVSTDMVALTPPLKSYIEKKLGGFDVQSEEFWNIYAKGLQELFTVNPNIDGIMLRIGEAGPLYNRDGWDYTSELMVRSVESVKAMLTSFLNVAERYDKEILFRTWSVGVGTLGLMHTDPNLYAEIFDDINSPNLILSTKLSKGDFWNHVELNPTLYQGEHRRIVELQARREFEAFNVIPNFVAPLYQDALNKFLDKNSNVEGVWLWTQAGGPIRQGPLMIYPFSGLWIWTDANVYVTARVLENPSMPIEVWTREWVANTFGDDPEVIENITELLMMSHETTVKGLTIPHFARKHVSGVGLEIPPVIYSYWDIVATSTTVMSLIYKTAQDEVQASINEAFSAVDDVRYMKSLFTSVEDKISKGQKWIPGIISSLEYEENLFETLAYHKQFVLKYYEWLDNGGKANDLGWQLALAQYNIARDLHMHKYGENFDYPAYNFEVADNKASQAALTGRVSWAARILLLTILGFAFFIIKFPNWGKSSLFVPVFVSLLAVGLLGVFTSLGAPYFLLTTIIPILIYIYSLRFIVFANGRSNGFTRSILPILVILAIILAVLSIRGPYFFWFNYWTNDLFRHVLTSTITILIMTHFYLVYKLTKGELLRRQVIGIMFIITGFLVSLYSMVYLFVGLERMLMVLNDEILLMPIMASRVLTFSTHLDNIISLLVYASFAGLALIVSGGLLSISHFKPRLFSKQKP